MVVGGTKEGYSLDESIAKVGVLGGIGPESTSVFYRKLIRSLQTRDVIERNTDFPQIVVNSVPAPELIYEEIVDEELKPYLEGLKELDDFGVDFIVMACNTIHLYYEKLQSKINTPLLNLREKVRKSLRERDIDSVLVLGTPNTVKQGLYKFEEVKTYEPSDGETQRLVEAIHKYNKGVEKKIQTEKVKKISKRYLKKDAETVIAGCTEFATMLEEENIPKVDTINILVDATIEKIIKESSEQQL